MQQVSERENLAVQIYDNLRGYADIDLQGLYASLEGFYNGSVVCHNQRRGSEIELLPQLRPTSIMLQRFGFNPEEVLGGVFRIAEYEEIPLDERWKIGTRAKQVGTLFVSLASDRAYNTRTQVTGEVSLETRERIQKINFLSLVPHMIIASFGNYTRFERELFSRLGTHPDWGGINNIDNQKGTLIYNGGLRAFCNSLDNEIAKYSGDLIRMGNFRRVDFLYKKPSIVEKIFAFARAFVKR